MEVGSGWFRRSSFVWEEEVKKNNKKVFEAMKSLAGFASTAGERRKS